LITEDICISHQNFFKRQHRYYKDDDKNIFVHGGFLRDYPIGETLSYTMMWDRKLWDDAIAANKHFKKLEFHDDINKIFIGHTTTESWGTTEPIKADIIWNLDTGAGFGGKLTLMDVETEEYWQSDLVPSLYPDDEHNLKNKI
jgi:serine/threonine protein phosphatase 1